MSQKIHHSEAIRAIFVRYFSRYELSDTFSDQAAAIHPLSGKTLAMCSRHDIAFGKCALSKLGRDFRVSVLEMLTLSETDFLGLLFSTVGKHGQNCIFKSETFYFVLGLKQVV